MQLPVKEHSDNNIDIESVSIQMKVMMGRRSCILFMLCVFDIIDLRKNVVIVNAAPRSKGEPSLTQVRSIRHWEHGSGRGAVQTSQNHRRVPKGT